MARSNTTAPRQVPLPSPRMTTRRSSGGSSRSTTTTTTTTSLPRPPSTSNLYLLSLLLLSLLHLLLSPVNAQLATSVDVNGNSIVYSVTTDDTGAPTTTNLQTIPATTQASIDLGQANSSPTATSSRAPPTTFLVYYTVDGVQTSSYSVFVATTPSTPPPLAPSSGTVLAYSDYITAIPTTKKKTSSAVPARKLSSKNGQVAAVGVLLSMLVGAIAVL